MILFFWCKFRTSIQISNLLNMNRSEGILIVLCLISSICAEKNYINLVDENSEDFNDKIQSGSLFWSCNSILMNSSGGFETCTGILSYNGNSISTSVDLQSLPFNTISAFAIDINNAIGYVFMSNGSALNESNVSVVSVGLKTQDFNYTKEMIVIENSDQILDAAFDSTLGKLFLLIQKNFLLSSESSLNVLSVDPFNAQTNSLISYSTEPNLYIGSTYSSEASTYFVVMGNESLFEMAALDMNNNEARSYSIPYGFAGIAYDNENNAIIGNLMLSPPGSNQLVSFSLSSSNITTIGHPFINGTCGGNIKHATIDSNNNYYSMCCKDVEGCQNATLLTADLSTNSLDFYDVPYLQEMTGGLFWSIL